MNRTIYILFVFSLFSLYQCAEARAPQSHEPRTEGQSHFLRSCTDECGSGLTCICGVCTVSCETRDNCSDLPGDAVCISPEELGETRQCRSFDPVDQSACDVRCEDDSDCSALDQANTCQAGFCRAEVRDGSVILDDVGIVDGDSGVGGDAVRDSAPRDLDVDATKLPTVLSDYAVARASDSFVFVPDPDNGEVLLIDIESVVRDEYVDIRRIELGGRPKYLATKPDENLAIVVDEVTGLVTYVRVSRAAQETNNVESVAGLNAIAFIPSSDSLNAIVYLDRDSLGGEEAPTGEDRIALVEPPNDEHPANTTLLKVGSGLSAPFFSSDAIRAFFWTDTGVTVMNLDYLDTWKYSFPDGINSDNFEIRITNSGRYFLGFEPQGKTLYLWDTPLLSDQQPDVLDMEQVYEFSTVDEIASITDVVFEPDSAHALVVMQNINTVFRIDIPRGFTDLTGTEPIDSGEVNDSIAITPSGDKALLFDRVGQTPAMTIVDLKGDDNVKTIDLAAGVDSAMFVTGLEETQAVVLIHDEPSASADSSVRGFSVLMLETETARLFPTSEVPRLVEDSGQGEVFFMWASGSSELNDSVYRVDTKDLAMKAIDISGSLLTVGTVADIDGYDNKGIFAQCDNDSGQILLIDGNGAIVSKINL